jgi:hypothetical protein
MHRRTAPPADRLLSVCLGVLAHSCVSCRRHLPARRFLLPCLDGLLGGPASAACSCYSLSAGNGLCRWSPPAAPHGVSTQDACPWAWSGHCWLAAAFSASGSLYCGRNASRACIWLGPTGIVRFLSCLMTLTS